MKRHISSFVILAGGILLIMSAGPILAQSYQEPGGSAPAGVVAPPLNASSSLQRKAGNLLIGPGGGSAAVCLNPDTSNPSLLPANNPACLANWTSLVGPLGGPFVRLDTDYLAADPFKVDNYARQTGYARIRAQRSDQAFSLLAKAANICAADFGTGDPCTWGGANCRCRTNLALSCTNNLACPDPPTGGQTTAAGIYGSDGGLSTNYAAVFEGTLYIRNVVGQTGQLCLNGTTPVVNCISSWDQIAGTGVASYVKLQTSSPAEIQSGGAKTSGVAQLSSVIAGDPAGLPLGTTCGDGLCSGPTEDVNTCAVDCVAVNQLSQFSAGPYANGVTFTATTAPQPPGGNVYVMIVKSTGLPPTFQPLDGTVYTAGQTFGNTQIVYFGQKPPSSFINNFPPDTDITTGQTIYYNAYQGTLFPRWSTPRSAALTLRRLEFSKSGNGGVAIGDIYNCNIGCTNLTLFFLDGATVNFEAFLNSGDSITYGGACSGDSCSVIMDADKFVSANITEGSGCGRPICG